MSTPKEAILMLVLLSFIYKSSAIHCYYCNSANNSACLDINQYEEEIRSSIISIVNCDNAIPKTKPITFFCRKIVQTIFHPHRDNEVRVTRGCGWMPHAKDCYTDDNSDHLGTSCQCFEDLCNSGESADPNIMVVLFLCFSIILYFWRE
ncbi:unnamed protein product [Pieris macdunnoughi]|uniref:Protein sleepless n=1 Tax=Pieris macdunnoughi TaxID=345717 RepID=A0A821RC68_9NEOP|nr:unnamed protein product [Pieris macdunnoughi]